MICASCKREDVPPAPLSSTTAGSLKETKFAVYTAHVTPKGIPCSVYPSGEDALDDQTREQIFSDLRWWSDELGGGAPAHVDHAAPAHVNPAPAVASPAPPKVGATKITVDAKGDFVISSVVAPPGPVAPPIEAVESAPESQRTEAPAPKRAPRKRKKKDDVDVDDWTP